MPIRPLFAGQAFDPETVEAMSDAFDDVCAALGLADRADPITELVARRLIELAQRGIRTKTALYLAAMQEFKR